MFVSAGACMAITNFWILNLLGCFCRVKCILFVIGDGTGCWIHYFSFYFFPLGWRQELVFLLVFFLAISLLYKTTYRGASGGFFYWGIADPGNEPGPIAKANLACVCCSVLVGRHQMIMIYEFNVLFCFLQVLNSWHYC